MGRLGTGMLLAFGFSTLRRKLDLKSHSSTHRLLFMFIFNPVLHSLSLSAMTDTPELGSDLISPQRINLQSPFGKTQGENDIQLA